MRLYWRYQQYTLHSNNNAKQSRIVFPIAYFSIHVIMFINHALPSTLNYHVIEMEGALVYSLASLIAQFRLGREDQFESCQWNPHNWKATLDCTTSFQCLGNIYGDSHSNLCGTVMAVLMLSSGTSGRCLLKEIIHTVSYQAQNKLNLSGRKSKSAPSIIVPFRGS